MTTTTMAMKHHHVVAVQDLGGTQERWFAPAQTVDDYWTRQQAEQLAHDMIEADTAYAGRGRSGMDIAAWDAAHAKFGDRLHELISGNVAPGWDAIYIVDCADPCSWDINQPVTGEPWWTFTPTA